MGNSTPNWTTIIGILIAGLGLIAGVLGWWISKFLADKKDIMSCILKIDNLERRVKDIEEEQRYNRREH